MEWTPEERLNLIKALAATAYADKRPKTNHEQRDLMQRIMFLCDMPPEFLEKNKGNYEDVIRLVQADLTVFL